MNRILSVHRSSPARLALLLTLVWAGCSSSRTTTFVTPGLPPGFPHHSVADVLGFIDNAGRGLESLRSRTRIRYQTAEEDGSVNLNISHRRGDSLYASIRVTLGLEAARALITPDSFFVYERVAKKLYYGEAEAIKAFFPTPAPLEELYPSLTGTLAPEPTVDWQISSDSLYYYLANEDETRSYTVDPRIWRVIRMEATTERGDLVELRTFSGFDWFGAYVLPRRVEATRPGDRQKVWVYHRSIEINPPELSLKFGIGDVSERILVRRDDF